MPPGEKGLSRTPFRHGGNGGAALFLILLLAGAVFAQTRDASARGLHSLGLSSRIEAIQATAKLAPSKAVPILKKILRQREGEIRRAAVTALAQVGGREAIEAIVYCLDDWDLDVAMTAAYSLAAMPDPLVIEMMRRMSAKGNSIQKANAVAVLAMKKDSGAADILLGLLKDRSSQVRANAANAMAMTKDPRALAPLLKALEDGTKVRAGAAFALGFLGDPAALDPLLQCLRDRDHAVRANAAASLGRLHDPRAIEPLAAALEDKYAQVRYNAAEALGFVPDPRSIGPLRGSARDRNAYVRMITAKSLGRLGRPETVSPLLDLVGDSDMLVRLEAVLALDQVEGLDDRVVDPLIEALKTEWSSVGFAAAGVLKRVTGQDLGNAYDKWREWRSRGPEKRPR